MAFHSKEHYYGLYGDRRSVQEASIENVLQQDVKLEPDNPPTEAEIKAAINRLQRDKAPGIYEVP